MVLQTENAKMFFIEKKKVPVKPPAHLIYNKRRNHCEVYTVHESSDWL